MATAAIPGRKAYIRASTASASTATSSQTALAELRDYTLTVTGDVIDVTSHDSNNFKETLPGIRSWSWTADLIYLSTGAGQSALRTAFLSTATAGNPQVNITFMQSTSTSTKKYQGKAYLTSFEISHATNDAVLGKLSGVGNGALKRVA